MNVSVRPHLVAGVAAATALTLTLTGLQVAPDGHTVPPAHPIAADPHLSQARYELLAAASRLTTARPAPHSASVVGTPTVGAAPSALAIAPNLANTIDNIYLRVEPWVEYGFELGAYALGWIPWVGGWAGGLLMDGYNFGQSIVASGVFNFTDWLRGDGGIVTNLVDFGVDVGLAFVWLGIDVVSTFIPLPPLPWFPPRPPLQGPFLAASLATPTATDATAVTAVPELARMSLTTAAEPTGTTEIPAAATPEVDPDAPATDVLDPTAPSAEVDPTTEVTPAAEVTATLEVTPAEPTEPTEPTEPAEPAPAAPDNAAAAEGDGAPGTAEAPGAAAGVTEKPDVKADAKADKKASDDAVGGASAARNSDKPAKAEKPAKPAKAEKPDKTEKTGKPPKQHRTDGPGSDRASTGD